MMVYSVEARQQLSWHGLEYSEPRGLPINEQQMVTILLVDDRPLVGKAIQKMLLNETDMVLYHCCDPQQAMNTALEIAPTVILQDLVMPDIDGLLLVRFFRAHPQTKEIPIIVLSSQEEPVLKARAFAQGANDYLIKLPDPAELIARLRYHSKAYNNYLKQQQAYQELEVLHQTLEQRVEERTAQLQQTLDNLQKTQAQLVQSEKMSSLGQLVAGVAHEINNPINFIAGNIQPALEYIEDLLYLLKLYEEHYPQPEPEIKDFQAEFDIDFLKEDLPKLISSMRIGAERISEIVQNLRNFSRTEQSAMKIADIHECLESTLLILQHRLKKSGIEVVKDYGEIPVIECYPGQLNQVFVNIIANAIDAIESQEINSNNPGRITITTESQPLVGVIVRIIDNGPGIADETKKAIFDPFFTTKPVGKGTGLGLSISYQIIVEKHRGRIYFLSPSEGGTECYIELPIRQH